MQYIIHKPKVLGLIIALGILNLFINNHSIALWDQDEAAYAGFAYQMKHTGNWVVPEFLWSEPHRKTPLHFWSIAAAYTIFGENEFAVRFPSALAILLSCWALYRLGKPLFGKDEALSAAIILLTSFFIPALAKISVTDALLLLFETIAALSLLNFIETPKWKWNLLFWLSIALGTLTKGPPILILTIGIGGILLLFSKKRKNLIYLHPWFFLPLALLPLFIWGRLAWLQDGGKYITWMIDWYILKRTKQAVFGQTGPPGYYFLTFCLAFLPWMVIFPKAWVDFCKNTFKKNITPTYLYLAAWLIAGWVIYEILPSKLPAYALGAYPAVALLLAKTALSIDEKAYGNYKSIKLGVFFYLFLVAVIAIGLAMASYFLLGHQFIGRVYVVSILFLGMGIAGVYYFKQGDFAKSFPLMACNSLLFIFLAWVLIIPSFEWNRSATKRVALYIEQNTLPTSQVIFTQNFNLPSLPFYIIRSRRRFIQNEDNLSIQNILMQKEKKVFVFERSKWEILSKNNFLSKKSFKVAYFKGWISDRGKNVEYCVVTN